MAEFDPKSPARLIQTSYKHGFASSPDLEKELPWLEGRENCWGFGVQVHPGEPEKEKTHLVAFGFSDNAGEIIQKVRMLADSIEEGNGVGYEVPTQGNEINAEEFRWEVGGRQVIE